MFDLWVNRDASLRAERGYGTRINCPFEKASHPGLDNGPTHGMAALRSKTRIAVNFATSPSLPLYNAITLNFGGIPMRHVATWIGGIGLMVGLAGGVSADDWPQWLGTNRDAIWRETGIIRK